LTPASKALVPFVIGEPKPFLDVYIGFWRFRLYCSEKGEFEPKAAGRRRFGLAGPESEVIICGGKRGIFYENWV